MRLSNGWLVSNTVDGYFQCPSAADCSKKIFKINASPVNAGSLDGFQV